MVDIKTGTSSSVSKTMYVQTKSTGDFSVGKKWDNYTSFIAEFGKPFGLCLGYGYAYIQ